MCRIYVTIESVCNNRSIFLAKMPNYHHYHYHGDHSDDDDVVPT